MQIQIGISVWFEFVLWSFEKRGSSKRNLFHYPRIIIKEIIIISTHLHIRHTLQSYNSQVCYQRPSFHWQNNIHVSKVHCGSLQAGCFRATLFLRTTFMLRVSCVVTHLTKTKTKARAYYDWRGYQGSLSETVRYSGKHQQLWPKAGGPKWLIECSPPAQSFD